MSKLSLPAFSSSQKSIKTSLAIFLPTPLPYQFESVIGKAGLITFLLLMNFLKHNKLNKKKIHPESE